MAEGEQNSGSKTAYANVHCVVACDECDFKAEWYLDAVKQGQQHHLETGHELRGEKGLAIWIGKEGQRRNEERTDRFMAALGLSEVMEDRDGPG